ncbi:MAG: hypothetical protein QXF13_05030 [Thermoproteota archaeon]
MKIHGVGGPFGGLVTAEVWNVVAAPTGLLSALPRERSYEERPEYAFLTGFDATTGSRPTNKCGTCQVVGQAKSCVVILPYGRMCYTSPSITVEDVLMRVNRGEPDLTLIGKLVSDEVSDLLRRRIPDARVLEAGFALGMVAVVRAAVQNMMIQLWTGDPASSTEAYAEPYGLERLLSTEYRDARTNTPCPDLNALRVSYDASYDAVSGGSFRLVELLREVMAHLEDKAAKLGLAPAEFAIVANNTIWYRLANLWSRAYITSGVSSLPSGATLFVDASGSNQLRDKMLSSGVLNVNGKDYSFIADSAAPVTVSDSTVTGSIYILPLRAAGRVTTYINYVDWTTFSDPNADWMNTIHTDDGFIQWYTTTNGPCFQVTGLIRWRPVTLPFLSAVITGVQAPAMAFPLVSGVPGTLGYSAGSGVSART